MPNASIGEVQITTSSGTTFYSPTDVPRAPAIGGDTCHLCGARIVFETADIEYRRRKLNRVFKRTGYKCGTVVNKKDGKVKVAHIGEKCLPLK